MFDAIKFIIYLLMQILLQIVCFVLNKCKYFLLSMKFIAKIQELKYVLNEYKPRIQPEITNSNINIKLRAKL